jgi:hypothetical protein
MRDSKTSTGPEKWVDFLSEEDAAFLKRFVLASGSLKELASAYGVTYPTIRLRLDRLIQKIEVVDNAEFGDPFERQLRGLLAEGRLEADAFKELLAAYRKAKNHD